MFLHTSMSSIQTHMYCLLFNDELFVNKLVINVLYN
jgi:hypothetical protein